jgi:Fe-S-cluster containining protein
MRDGPLLRGVKRVLLWNFQFDVWVSRLVSRLRGETPYRLGGRCEMCARCCEAPAIRVGRLLAHAPLLRRGLAAFERAVNGFELTGWDRRSRTLTFRCTHFDWQTRRCDSYESRPGMCRDYPRILLYQPRPEMLPGCGYRPVSPSAARLRAALGKENLTQDQWRALEKGLFLEE